MDMKLNPRFESAFDNLVHHIDDWKRRDQYVGDIKYLESASDEYLVNCTGDVVAGDHIVFIHRQWEKKEVNDRGKVANVITDYQLIEAIIDKESYGERKQQHTFSLILTDGERMLIKGRNLYAVGVWRKNWSDEESRMIALDEKHKRGARAREQRNLRLNTV